MEFDTLVLANFGGPRSLLEIESFLTALLCDQDVVRTALPSFIHRALFTKIASKRSEKVSVDYEEIGGKSPLYEDTNKIAKQLEIKLNKKVIPFHRYIPATHKDFIDQMLNLKEEKILVLPLFPQFTYATTGSLARFFQNNLPEKILDRMKWVPSYFEDPRYISCFQKRIAQFLEEKNLKEEETILLFSAHGIPQSFVKKGDPYQFQCERSFSLISKHFEKAHSRLCYQSKFGPGKWLMPYTGESSSTIDQWGRGRKNVVFIPLAFTSDHLETLFEIEKLYMPITRDKGFSSYRCPALNLFEIWIETLVSIAKDPASLSTTQSLVRK